jgi:5-methylcytosine-specific restriction enzyme subunit McrC
MPRFVAYEYDSIPCKISGKRLTQFQKHLQEIWQRRWEMKPTETSPRSVQAYLAFENSRIKAQNYVGIIHWEDFHFQILPKIFASSPALDTALIGRHLLYYLSYADSWNYTISLSDLDTFEGQDWAELSMYILVLLIEDLIQQEPYFHYQRETLQVKHWRGKLAVQPYLLKSIVSGNWQDVYCEVSHWQLDNQFNRILKYVCRQIFAKSSLEFLQTKTGQILQLLHMVSDEICTYADCMQVEVSSLLPLHRAILENCKMYLLNEEINPAKGQVPSFFWMIPMESLYERFIAGFIRVHFPEWSIEVQSRNYLATTGEGKEVFQIRSDIYLPLQHIIMDTKYKLRLPPFHDERYGVSPEDVYQVLSYGVARACRKMILLYPALFQEQNIGMKQRKFTISNPFKPQESVAVYAMDLDITMPLSSGLKEKLDQKIKKQINDIIISLSGE